MGKYHFMLLASAVFHCSAKNLPQDSSTRIVGGQAASQGQFPYIIHLTFRGEDFCGASLIEVNGTQAALTASYCLVWNRNHTEEYRLVAGELNLDSDSGFEQVRTLENYIFHPEIEYSLAFANDVVILFFNEPFNLNENVKPIPLPKQHQNMTVHNVTVSGWGALSYFTANCGIVALAGNAAAQSFVRRNTQGRFLCYGRWRASSGQGRISSGSSSFPFECEQYGYPGIFTRVSHFTDWIESTVISYTQAHKSTDD